MTDIQINEKEKDILEINPKYNPMPSYDKHTNLVNNLINAEVAIQKIKSHLDADRIRYAVVEKVLKEAIKPERKVYNNEKGIIKEIKQKLSDNNAVIIPADKSNSSVIINSDELNDKVKHFLHQQNITEIKDNTNSYNKEIKEFLDNNTIIHPNTCPHLYNKDASPPIFRPLIKTHKEDKPIRPVINAKPAPSYKLAKYINNLIKNHLPNGKHSCKNTKDFLNRLSHESIQKRDLMISIDVDNMYANIPKQEAIEVLKRKLTDSESFLEEEINDIIKATNLILNQSYFTYNNKIYYDKEGLPMGGPLSATLAELYMQHFEETYIMSPNNPYLSKIKMYARYVDDSFLILKSSNERQANLLLNQINKSHHKIKFKLETEQNDTINFLDVTVTKTDSLKTKIAIYRKPTQTDLVIPAHSNHPYNYKIAAFRSMVYRLLNYNLEEEEFKKEKKTIETIAIANGYKIQMIHSLIQKMTQKIKTPMEINTEKSSEKYVSIHYVDTFTNKIGSVFKKAGYNPAFIVKKEPIPTYGKHKKEEIKLENKKGVYEISCHSDNSPCNKKYIGYTNRNLLKRFKEHNTAHYNNPESLVAKHLKSNPNHKIKFPDSIKLLNSTSNKEFAKTQESYEIYKYIKNNTSENLLNKQEDFRNTIIFQTAQQLERNNGCKSRPGATSERESRSENNTAHSNPSPSHPQHKERVASASLQSTMTRVRPRRVYSTEHSASAASNARTSATIPRVRCRRRDARMNS